MKREQRPGRRAVPGERDRGAERPHRLGGSHDAREQQAERTARKLAGAAGGSGRVADPVRRAVERWSGHDLSEVDVRHGRTAGAIGSTDGSRITIDPTIARSTAFAEHVLLHEFVHAAQVEESVEESIERGEEPATRRRPLQMFFCAGCGSDSPAPAPAADPLDPLTTGKVISATEAEAALKMYESATPAARDNIVAKFHTAGNASSELRRLISALPDDVRVAKAALIDDLLRRLQTRTTIAKSGQTVAQMGKTQATWRQKKAEADAAAKAAADAKAKGLPPPKAPTAAQVSQAEKVSIEAESIQPANTNVWGAMNAAQQAAWTTRAGVAIAAVVAACAKAAPELKITAANIDFDAAAIEARGADIMAFSGNPITVGLYFIQIAEAEPEYAVGTVIHEIVGHPEYVDGPEWEIHKESLKTFPTSASLDVQHDLYNYVGTELHAVLREFEYYKPVSAADAKAGIDDMNPDWIVRERLKILKNNYEPSIAAALLSGMWDRFRTDPRITNKALAMFRSEAAAVMPAVRLP